MSLFDRLYRLARSNIGVLSNDRLGRFRSVQSENYTFPDTSDDDAPSPQRTDLSEAEYYANLELPLGASYDEIKKAYRELLRRYHPDRHTQDPEKAKLADEITKRLNQAMDYFRKKFEKGV